MLATLLALRLATALACLVAGLVAPATAQAQEATSPAGTEAATPADSPVDYLWVLRNSLVRAEDVPRVVQRAKDMGVRGILVQVVGRGDAWYHSERLPAPEPMQGAGRDPLGEILPLARAAGIEVHAWINCCLVWSGPRGPRDGRHVLRTHPEWVARLADGRSMARLTPRQLQRLRVEGVFLSPMHPGVQRWVAENVQEIVRRYPVDGVHLDYIRSPGVAIGNDPTSRARFALESGVDPITFNRRPKAERARLEAEWLAFQQEQVTAIVRGVRDSIAAVRPGLPLSAAVVADTVTALTLKRQPWSRWVRDGLLDRAYLMCYAPSVQVVLDQLDAVARNVGAERLVPGIAVYNAPASSSASKIKAARALGYPAVALYSYDSLYEKPGLWERLRALLTSSEALEVKP
jgi:uncharacterized lipoprotein YddW (UPF0748 family)